MTPGARRFPSFVPEPTTASALLDQDDFDPTGRFPAPDVARLVRTRQPGTAVRRPREFAARPQFSTARMARRARPAIRKMFAGSWPDAGAGAQCCAAAASTKCFSHIVLHRGARGIMMCQESVGAATRRQARDGRQQACAGWGINVVADDVLRHLDQGNVEESDRCGSESTSAPCLIFNQLYADPTRVERWGGLIGLRRRASQSRYAGRALYARCLGE